MKYIISAALAIWLSLFALNLPAATHDAQAVIQQTADRVIERIQGKQDALRDDPAQLRALINEMIIPHFDFERMARWVLGKHWRSADNSQQIRFTEQFRELLIRTYSTALLEYSQQAIEYLPVQDKDNSRSVIVKTRMSQGQGINVIPIDYRMRQGDDQNWKIFDVSVDGVSLISTYRSSFSSIIRSEGIDALINSLVSKNQKGEP